MKLTIALSLCLLSFLLLATERALSQESSKDHLRDAKSICVTAPEGPSLDLKSEVIKKLVEWNKLTIVSDQDKADLILKVTLTRGYSGWKGKGARGTAELSDRPTGSMLWATSEGGDFAMSGFSNGKVDRKIANKFIEFYQKQTKR
jgi:hypothetical protein